MATVLWHGTSVAIKQVGTVRITGMSGTPSDTTYTITATDEDGKTSTVNTAGITNATATATALKVAWNANASGSPHIARVTATSSTDTITFTADTSGVPFSGSGSTLIASSAAGGTGAIGAFAETVANSGPNDFAVANNWSSNAVVTNSDDAIITAGSPSILYGLTTGVSPTGLMVEEGYTGTIGGTDDAYLKFVTVSATIDIAGTGKAWIDIGAAGQVVNVHNSYSPSAGQHGLCLKGTAMTAVNVYKGDVGIGCQWGDGTTEVDTINVLFKTNEANDAKVTLGELVSDTSGGGVDVNMGGGYLQKVNGPGPGLGVVNMHSSKAKLDQFDTATTVTCVGGIINSRNVITTLTLSDGATLNTNQSGSGSTYTNVAIGSNDGIEINDELGLSTFTNGLIHGSGVGHNNNKYNLGVAKTFTIS